MTYTATLTKSIEALSEASSYKGLFRQHADGVPLPSAATLKEVVQLSRAILFPGYYGNPSVQESTLAYHIGVNVERLYELLRTQIEAGLRSDPTRTLSASAADDLREEAALAAARYIDALPEMRRTLATDVEATYYGDPAATSPGEVICCYPAIRAIGNYRMAHTLLTLGVPLIPRIITEMAHSETGIDIHPGAQIGPAFTIDHGTGVVIGETCIIGRGVKLYQGVTLGARSFPLDAEGNPVKRIARHPILEDEVIVYSNATILGRITIGRGAVIGGNIWVTEDVAPGARIVQRR